MKVFDKVLEIIKGSRPQDDHAARNQINKARLKQAQKDIELMLKEIGMK